MFADHEDLLAPAAMTLNSSSHPGEQYVGGRARRSLLDHTPRRFPRSYSQEYFIEIMVVADKKMAEYHGDGLYHYILTLMSIVSIISLSLILIGGRMEVLRIYDHMEYSA